MGKLLALLWRAVNDLFASRFEYTEGIEAAPVVGRKNARVCTVDKLSGSRCPFSKLSWSMAPMLSRSTKKRSFQVSPTQTSQLLLQRRVPPAVTPLSGRAQAALAAFVVLLVWAGSACAAGCVPSPLSSSGASQSRAPFASCALSPGRRSS